MINSVSLVGRLTKDVTLRQTQSGIQVASFTVAVDRPRKGQDGNYPADFINCVAWRQSAQFLATYAHKGTLVGVKGSLQTRTYDKQDGTKGFATEVVADEVNVLERTQANPQARMAQQPMQQGVQMYQQPVMQAAPMQQMAQQPVMQQPMMQAQSQMTQQPMMQAAPMQQPVMQQQAAQPMQPQPVYDATNAPALDISNDDLPF